VKAEESSTEIDSDEAALMELNRKRQEVQKSLIQLQGQLDSKRNTKRRSALTTTELQEMPGDVITYKAVGRMFL